MQLELEVSDFHYPYPLLIITGKGGVGKTVLTAALGTASAASGLSTLLVELGGQRQLLPMLSDTPGRLLDEPVEGPVELSATLAWESLDADRLLARWLSGRSMGLVADRLERTGALSVIATSVPGIQDVLVLGYLRSTLESGRWDRIIVDGPASGRARELLRAPRQVAQAATEGPVHDQGRRAHDLLTDHDASAVVLVTIPEETPVNETIETAFDIEDDPGVRLGGVIVNRIFPHREPPASFDAHPLGPGIRAQHATNIANMARLDEELPVPRRETLELPQGIRSPADIAALFNPPPELAVPSNSPRPKSDPDAIDALLQRPVVITVGTGGVGKTTMSAALAVRATQLGKSVALITIDPAKRLIDALGLETLDDDLRPVPVATGALKATMLDPGRTFERIIRQQASSDDHAERILASPLAHQLADSLSGMTEYMAVERLWELHADPAIDLVIVDTPPSSDALAFLDAPTLLARLLDNRMYKMLVHTKKRSIFDRAIGGFVNQLVSVVGGAVVRDAVAFFQSFEGIEDGFRQRGDEIHELLRSNDHTGVALVASPTGASLDNARAFTQQLADAGAVPELTIINRLTPEVPDAGRSKIAAQIVGHLRKKRAAEHVNIADYLHDAHTPVVLVDDLATPVTNLASIIDLANRIASNT